jgi:hypothetical protein
MRNISSVSAAALLSVAVCSTASGQVTLQRKHAEGSSTCYETTFLLNQVMTISGMEFKSTADVGETRTMTTGKRNTDDTIPITTKIDATRLNLTIPGGGQLLFDSSIHLAKTADPKLEPLLDVLRASVGASYTLLVDRQEQVTGVEGVQEILARAPAKAAELIKSQFSTETLARGYRESVEILPSDPVSPGDAWERTITIDLGAGQIVKVERRCEYKGSTERNGRTLDEITVTDKRIASFEIQPNDEFPAKVAASDLAPADDSKGQIYFDRELGIDVESTHVLHLKGKMTLTIQGMELPSELIMRIDSQSKLKK